MKKAKPHRGGPPGRQDGAGGHGGERPGGGQQGGGHRSGPPGGHRGKHNPRHGQRPRSAPPSGERPAITGAGGDWLYGTHAVLAALGNPKRRLRRLLATSETATALPPNLPLPAEIMGPEKIAQALPREAVHQGLALLADALPGRALADCAELAEPAFLVALDQVTDPHNVGAILRSAAAFGAQGVILTERHAPGTGGVLAKAASGALEHVPLIRVVNLAQTLAVLKEWGYAIVGLAEDGTLNIAQLPPSRRTVLVLGAEGEGLRRLTRERCDVLVKLPTQGPIASLNVSNAAAVALYALKEKMA